MKPNPLVARHCSLFRLGLCGLIALAAATPRLLAAEKTPEPRKMAAAPATGHSEVEHASFEKPLAGAGAAQPRPAGASRGGKPKEPGAPGGVPLPARGQARGAAADSARLTRPVGTASTLATGAASLAVVLGLFFVVAWALRRGMPRGSALLPGDVVEVLGRAPLSGRQFAHLVRCGNKLLLVHLAPGCAETLTEITDPVEVDRLAGMCKQAQPQSTTASFRQVFQQFSREKPDGGGRSASGGTLLSKLRDHQPADTAFEDTDA